MDNLVYKNVGEFLLKKVGTKAFGGVAGRVIGIGAVAFGTYEFFNTLNNNIKAEPVFQEMVKYETELEKLRSIISCLGREPYVKDSFGSVNEGGCINALSRKKLLNLDRYPSSNQNFKAPDPELGKSLLETAIEESKSLSDELFEEKKEGLIQKLEDLNNQIKLPYQPDDDYSPIQQKVSETVRGLIPKESEYMSKIYNCQLKLQKTLPKNTAWSFASLLTLGIIKKKNKK